jgi:putative DNA primase/helicase
MTFLDETFGRDPELIRFVKQWCGYSLTGDVSEHALLFGSGGGGNGKSVFVNTITGILGEYATTAAMDTFVAARGERHPTELAMLRGARMVTASETEERGAWAESRLKQLTGGDRLSARFMRQDFFTYQPQFKLTIIGNHRPALRNVDEAMRRRLNIVPFDHRPASPDRKLEEKLRAEWPGILRWMIEGCLDWLEHGLVRPTSVADATESYFSDQDMMGEWLASECVVEPANRNRMASTQDLFASWTTFAKANNEPVGSVKSFSEKLQKRGFSPDKNVPTALGKKVRGYRGVELRVEQRLGAAGHEGGG